MSTDAIDIEANARALGPAPSLALVPHENPGTLMRHASDVAGVCREIVLKTASNIQGRKFVRVEGWQAIATAHGCCLSIEEVSEDDAGNVTVWSAVRRLSDGLVLAKGQGFVGVDEKTWGKRDRFARRAMAQTRAMSRVARSVFAHVVVLIDANLSTTPAEEMTEEPEAGANRSVQDQPPTQRGTPPKKTPPRGNGGAKQGLPDALKRFDERCKAKLVAQAKDSPFADSWRRYAIDKGWILPNEDLDAIMGNFTQVFTLDPTKTSEENGPAVQAQFLAHERAVKELALGPATKTDAPQPELPAVEETSKPNPDWVDACPNCDHITVIMSPAFDGIMFCKACAWQWDMATGDYYEEHDWEKAVCPIPPKGTLKKDYEPQTLGQIARLEPKRFYGLVMNNQEAKGWTGRDGKYHEPSQADLDFAEACQAAVLHMEQSKQQDADPEAYD